MRCEWCGEETSDNSAFCAHCGYQIAEGGAVPEASGQELPIPDPEEDELVDAPSAVGDAFGFELAFDDDGSVEFVQDDFFSHDAVIPPVQPPDDGEPLVEAPSVPDELVLGRSYVVIIAVMATLFAAAVILLACVVLMRVLGL